MSSSFKRAPLINKNPTLINWLIIKKQPQKQYLSSAYLFGGNGQNAIKESNLQKNITETTFC